VFFVALATDYDGTLAKNGRVDASTIDVLRDLHTSGRKLILVTGRELPDLKRVFPALDLFDMVVAENGGLLFEPGKNEEVPLAEPPPAAFVARLREIGVSPLSIGRTIVSTWEPNEMAVLQVLRELGLELHIIFNKGAVMILPTEVNKAFGLKHALKRLCLSPHNVVGIGDAENDLAFLGICGRAVAVANALPSVKAKSDFLVRDHGAGVRDVGRRLTGGDFSAAKTRIPRALPIIGYRRNGSELHLSPFETVLVTGSSGSGKSTIVTALLEQMCACALQFCVVDPEGDYVELDDAVVVGTAKLEPRLSEVCRLLARPDVNVVINLLAIDPPERPGFMTRFLPEVAKLRAGTGRPHWIVLDEAHHCLPAGWEPAPISLPQEFPAAIAVTVHPGALARNFLRLVSNVIGVGEGAHLAIDQFCAAVGRPMPAWLPHSTQGDVHVLTTQGSIEVISARRPSNWQKRHLRKYAEGELGPDRSFYFRGPRGVLNLRAQNLNAFLQLAEGVDEETWTHHLRAGHYSRWFRDVIKDDELACETRSLETDQSLSSADARARIKDAIRHRYTGT
jgi:hydroxymethylpyrimidine pyrophosphatase-like HAD family hydrolase